MSEISKPQKIFNAAAQGISFPLRASHHLLESAISISQAGLHTLLHQSAKKISNLSGISELKNFSQTHKIQADIDILYSKGHLIQIKKLFFNIFAVKSKITEARTSLNAICKRISVLNQSKIDQNNLTDTSIELNDS